MNHTTNLQVFALALLVTAATTSDAVITYAAKGKFSGRVTVEGKAANTTLYIWQSDGNGGWVNTGASIRTDASGNGTVRISNASSGTLLEGHQVKTGTFNHPSDQTPGDVVQATNWLGFQKWFASVNPGQNGPQMCSLYQNVVGGGHVFTETWNPNTMLSMRFNPAQASWINMGGQMSTTGDLQAQLLGIFNDRIDVRIVNDPTSNTDDGFKIDNIGMYVQAPIWSKFPMFLDFMGSTREFLDGAFLGQYNFPNMNSSTLRDIYVVPQCVILPDNFEVLEGDLLSGDMNSLPLPDGNMLRMLNDESSLRTAVSFSGECQPISSFFSVFANIEVNRPGLSFDLLAWNYQLGAYRSVAGGAAPTNTTVACGQMGPAYYPADCMAKAKLVFAPINDEDPSQDGWLCSVDHLYWQGQ